MHAFGQTESQQKDKDETTAFLEMNVYHKGPVKMP